jgi:hypothetical protein
MFGDVIRRLARFCALGSSLKNVIKLAKDSVTNYRAEAFSQRKCVVNVRIQSEVLCDYLQ